LLVFGNLRAAPLTWFPGAALNEPRSSAATVVTPGGGIMIFGGYPIGSTNVLVYGGGNAQPLSLSQARVAPGAVALGSGQFFVFGGRQTNFAKSATGSALSYNPVPSNLDDPNIFSVSPLNTARSDMAYAHDASGFAYAIGGVGKSTNVLASMERYDPVNDSWTNMAGVPVGQYSFGAVFDGTNTIYTFGGRTNVTGGTEIATVLSYDVSGNVWSVLAPMPVATAGSAAIKGADGKYYVFGGTAGGVVTNLVQVYDPGGNTWSLATPLPVAVTGASAAVDTLGRLVVMGGADSNNVNVATSWLSQQLNLPDAAPTFTSYPPVKANCLSALLYSGRASGNPQPTYQLLTAPDGMQIDLYSGLVTWTPQTNQFGTNVVAIVATNYSGTATQTFTINVLGPVLAAPSNLVEAAVTDTSVTLSWDPTAYVIGPLTYQVYQRTFIHDPRGSGGGYYYGLIATTSANSVTISGLAVGSAHTYVVKASAAGVVSPYSAALGIVTTSPQPPQNLRLTALTTTTTSLAWDPSPGPVPIVSYSLIDYGSGSAVTNATGLTNTFITLTGLVPGSYHYYEVFAFDAAGHPSSPLGAGATYLIVWNPLPAPATLASVAVANGAIPGPAGFQFAVQSGWLQTTFIQATTNPADPATWTTIATNPPSSAFTFTDTNSSQFPLRFYRVLSQ
jgi:hypothetical protein